TNNFIWQGVAFNTYQASSPWKNLVTSNGLADWTNLDAVEQAFADITDPNTAEPILNSGATLLVPPAVRANALRVIGATQVRMGDLASGSGVTTVSASPVSHYRVESSRL